MRKIATILFVLVYLLGNTEVGQLINLPGLVKHYKFHHQIDKKLGFADFLLNHYIDDDGISTDNRDDNQLPFRQLHKPFSLVLMEIPVYASFFSNISPNVPLKTNLVSEYYPLSGFHNKILQPPDTLS
ncbi:MAG: hypothetical protein QM725_06415 [Lacibacter sp.]